MIELSDAYGGTIVHVLSLHPLFSPSVMKGSWCNIIVLNVHTPSEEKGDDFLRNQSRILIIFLSTV